MPERMIVLGINGYDAARPDRGVTHNSGAALVDETGKVIAAIDEERISRVKNDKRYPHGAIRETLRTAKLKPEAITHVALAHWSRKRLARIMGRSYREALNIAQRKDFQSYLRRRILDAYFRPIAEVFRPRTLPRELSHLPSTETRHHEAHAASAYFCCPWPDRPVLVLTLDGFGDGECGSVWIGENGKLRREAGIDFLHSIGSLYTAITYQLGFKPLRHEGKIVGLAAFAEGDAFYARLMEHITLLPEGAFTFDDRLMQLALAALRPGAKTIFAELAEGFSREEIAAGIQKLTEHLVCRWVDYWVKNTGIGMLALAGGVFANVKLNQRILELDGVDNVYVHPNMGDGGLGVGAALAAIAKHRGSLIPRFLDHVYLGPEITEQAAKEALEKAGIPYEAPDDLPQAVAELLADGKVVARAAGRMEYGPRALCNRSILAACQDPTINDWLNKRLGRTEFMPFAPVVMEEHMQAYFPQWKPEHVAARFMTITYDASEKAKREIPAAIHVDGTARPQALRREDNPEAYAILEAYYKKTGIPALINTSFNMHEEPIVCTAGDAVRAFLDGNLDALVLGPYLARKSG